MLAELLWLLLPWSLAFVFLGRLRPCPPLPKSCGDVNLSIIIPARDEERRLTPLLQSLKTQDHPRFEVIVVDDNSTDRTAALARQYGAIVITLTELAPGWLGKPQACWVGARHATGELFVFLDADTRLEPGALRRLAATHARYGGLVSVQPYHAMERPYERLSALFFIVMMGSIRSFTLAGGRLQPDGCFGPCILCARDDYVRTGGHRLVRDAIVDDVALGRQMRRLGMPVHNFIGHGTLSLRMYPDGLRDLIEGWTKNFASGALETPPWLLLPIVAWVSGGVATLDALRGGLTHGWSDWVAAGLAAYAAYGAQLWWLLRRLGNFGALTALTYPIALTFFLAVFVRSLYLTLVRRRVTWKGRSIPVRGPR